MEKFLSKKKESFSLLLSSRPVPFSYTAGSRRLFHFFFFRSVTALPFFLFAFHLSLPLRLFPSFLVPCFNISFCYLTSRPNDGVRLPFDYSSLYTISSGYQALLHYRGEGRKRKDLLLSLQDQNKDNGKTSWWNLIFTPKQSSRRDIRWRDGEAKYRGNAICKRIKKNMRNLVRWGQIEILHQKVELIMVTHLLTNILIFSNWATSNSGSPKCDQFISHMPLVLVVVHTAYLFQALTNV